MKTRNHAILVLFGVLASGFLGALPAACAATVTWNGTTGGDWNLATNWTGSAKPGASDTAIFNTTLATVANAIANQSVGSISFDTNAGTASGTFTLGTTGGNILTLGNNGIIQILSTLAGTGKSISVNSPIVLTPASTTTAGSYTFANYSIDPTNTLNFGGTISASTTSSTETLTLAGTNLGANTISGLISNGSATTFALAKSGVGTWTLTGANTYNGGTAISAGTLKIGNATALGANGGAVSVTAGAALDLNGTVMTNTNGLILNGLGVNGGGALTNSSGTAGNYAGLLTLGSASSIIAGSGNITLSNAGTITGATFGLTLGGEQNGTIASIIGTTTGTLTKQDAGTWTLSGANTYTGGTTITAGTLQVNRATALGTGAVSVASGAALDLNGITMTGTNALTINGSGISGGGALVNNNNSVPWNPNSTAGTYAGTVAMASDSSIGGSGATLTLSGIVGGAFNLTKVGSNTLVLSNTGNTFGASKTFTISAGTVQLGAATLSLGVASNAVSVTNGATLDLNGKAFTTLNALTINGQYSSTVGALTNSIQVSVAGALVVPSYAGTVTLGSDSSIGGNSAGILTLSGVVSGANNLTKVGTGGLLLSNAANTFGGAGKTFTISAGTVYLGAATTSLGAAGTAVTVSNGAVLNLNGKLYTTNNPLTINGSGIGGTGALMNSGFAASYSSDVTLGSDSTIGIIAGAAALTLSGNLTGTGNLTLIDSSASVLTLANVNNTGTVTNSGSGGTAAIITTLGSNVTGLTQAGATPFTVTNAIGLTSGPMSFTSTGAGLLTLSGQVTGAQNITLTANSTGNITLSNGANNGGSITNNGTGNGTVTVGSIGTNVTGVTQNAANGILYLNGTNTYTGNTTIAAGTLKAGSGSALGNSTSTASVAATGAALDLNGQTITNALTLNGTGISGGGALTNNSATAGTYSGLITLGSDSSIVAGSGNITVSNVGSITGATFGLTLGGAQNGSIASSIDTTTGTLTKQGAGKWTLSGTNTYTGTTTVSAGTLQFAKQASLYNSDPVSWTATNIIVSNNGTLALNVGGTGEFTTANVTALLANLGGANGTSTTGFAQGSAIGFDTTNASGSTFTVADPLADSTGSGGGALGVTKLGTNTLVLTAANTYNGPTTISAGALTIQNATALGSSSGAVSVTSGAALQIQNGITVGTKPLTLNGTGISSGGALRNISGTNVWQSTVTLGSAARINSDLGLLTFNTAANSINGTNTNLTLGGAGNGTIAGTITTGNGTLTKDGAGTWTLSAANTYSGNTLVSAGVLALGDALALQNSAIDTTGTGTITLTGYTTPTIGGLTGSRDLASVLTTGYSAVTNLTLNPGASITYSGAIANGPMALTKTGAGTQILSGTNTYTGTTTVSAGTLQFGKQASLYNSDPVNWTAANIIVANTGTLALNVGGTGEFTTANVTALLANLGGANGTSTNGFAQGSAIGFDTTNASGLTFTVGDILADSTGSGGGTLGVTKLGTNTLVLTGNSTYTGPTTITAGTLQIGNTSDAGSIDSTSAITDNGTLTYNVGAGNRTVSAAISGTGSITQNGTGTLTLSGANSFTGNVTLNAGTLALNNASALGTSNGTLTIAASTTLDNTSAAAITLSSNKTVTLNGDFAFTGTKDLNLGNGTVYLGTAAGTSRTITSNSGNLTLGGIISNGVSASSIIKAGAGALTLGGANTFTGGVTLNAGTLNINAAAALGTNTSTLFIADGTTLGNTSGTAISMTVNNPQTWNGNFTFTGAGLSNVRSDLYMGGAVSLGTALGTSRTITVTSGTLDEGGVIGNGTTANSLIKEGAGALSLTGTNTFTGGVTLNAGTLNINAIAALGTTAGTFTINGGTLAVSQGNAGSGGSNGLLTSNYVQVWNGDFGFTVAPVTSGLFVGYNSQNLNIGTGTVSLGNVAGGNATRTITVGAASAKDGYYANFTVGGIISNGSNGSSANSITKNGTGVLTLNGANTFTGGVTLNAGTLQLGNAAALGTGTLTINGGSLAANVATTLTNVQVWNGAFSVRPSIPAATGFALNMGTGAVTLAGNSTVTNVAGALLTVGGAIGDGANTYGVTWVAGYNANSSFALTGNSTYHGPTVVQSLSGTGSVVLGTGNLTNTSGVTVNGGGNFQVGTTGVGVTNRINPNASLTLGGNGGGTFTFVNSGNAVVNKQSFTSLTVGSGNDMLRTDVATNASQLTFTGVSGTNYNRNVGGVVRFVGLLGNASSQTSFTNAVTGNIIGSGTSAMLIGATTSTGTTADDAYSFVGFTSGNSGNLTAITSTANTFGSGVNTTLATTSFGLPTTGTTQSLRFDGATTLTLPSAFTVQSGGILATWNVVAPITITGGTLTTGLAGGDLWIVQSSAASAITGMVLKSQIVDNSNSSLTKVGARALYLKNTSNTYAGGTYLADGILNVASEGSLGIGALNFTGAATLQAAGNVTLGTRAVAIGQGVTATFDTNGNAITVGGLVSGVNSGLTKTGFGMLTLTGNNTYTGITTVNNGTLKLDFSAVGAPTENIINPNSLLALGVNGYSDTLIIQGAAGVANTQTFGATPSPNNLTGATTFYGGMTNMVFHAGAGGSLTVNLGNIIGGPAGGGAYLDVSTSGNVTVAGVNATTGQGSYLDKSFLNGGGNLNVWATVNKSTWATVNSSGNLVGFADSAYTTNYTAANLSGAMVDVTTSGTLSPTNQAAATTLRFNDTLNTGVGKTLSLVGTKVYQLSMGGILVTSNVGAQDSTINGGFLTGANLTRLGIFQNNTLGNLVINSQLVDQAGACPVIKNGAGTVILNGVNVNTGGLTVNEGTVIATGDYMPSSVKTITTTAGSNVVAMSDTTGLFVGQQLIGSTPGLAVTNGQLPNVVTAINPGVSVTISNNATASNTLSATFQSGGAIGSSASIANGATLQIGSTATGNHGGIDPTLTITNLGALILNHSGNYTFGNTLSGSVAINSLSATNATNTLEITGGGNTTLGAYGVVNGSGAGGQNYYTLATAGNVYAGQLVTGTNLPGGTYVNTVDGLNVYLSKSISTGGATNLTFQTINTFNGNTRITDGSTLTLASARSLDTSTLLYNNSDSGTLSFGSLTAVTLGGLGGDKNLALTNASSAAVALTVGGNHFDTTYSGNLTGTGSSLAKTGIGTLTLTGTNSYTGGTSIAAGGTLMGNSASLQGNISVASGATVAFNQTSDGTYSGVVSGASGVTFIKSGAAKLTLGATQAFSGLVDVQAGTLAVSANTTLTDTQISGGTFDTATFITSVGVLTMSSGSITGTGVGQVNASSYSFTDSGSVSAKLGGNVALTKSGAGTVTLTGANTYSGITTISGGTLQLGDGGFTGSSGGGAIVNNANFAINRSTTASQGADFSAAAITGNGTFTQAGTGNTTLNAANAYTGKTIVQNGTLAFTTGNASSTGAQSLGANADLDLGVASTSSGILNYTGTGAATLAKNINALGNGTDTIQNSGTGLLTLSGTLTKNSTTLTLKGGSSGINVTGAIAGSGANSDLIVDGGNTTLSTANTYNGPTSIINGATLTANATGALPTAIRSAVSIDQTGSGTSTLALGASQSAASLTGTSTSKVTLGANTLTLGMTGNATTTFSGVISGTNGNVIKDGTSTQVFSGNNTFTGTTAVNEGTLEAAAAGALGGTTAITVTNTGTLLLSANAATSNSTTLTLSGGTVEIKSGPSVSTSLGALTLTDNSIIDFGLSSGTNILTLGAVTSWTATKTIEIWNWSGTPFTPGGTDRLMVSDQTGWTTNLGSINFFTDSGTTLIGAATFAGYELVAVPEPATWSYMAAIALGGAVLLIRRRRDS
ncbi:MAG: autotransporter-associated beta strand repeat-containing protein [Verrucomicrobiae bacterium]